MAGADPAIQDTEPSRHSNLALRWASSLVLAPVVVGFAYLGGWPFVALWTLAACLVLWEWSTLVRTDEELGSLLSVIASSESAKSAVRDLTMSVAPPMAVRDRASRTLRSG